jgi:hypothetical protein
MKIIILLLLSTVVVSVVIAQTNNTNVDDPYVGATLENFEVETDTTAITKFACVDAGARCAFRRLSYESIDFGTGQETDDIQGAAWAATTEDAILTMGPCLTNGTIVNDNDNNCVVTCNANCTCAYVSSTNQEPQSCNQLTTRVPTPAPETSAPVPRVCPERQFTDEFCPSLMQTALPEGVIDNYDCFNFCGGIWVSTCDYSGTCGTQDCDNKTATGTITGVVKGCTIEHYNQKSSINKNNNKSSDTSGTGSIKCLSAFILIMIGIISSIVTIW